ncbi:hypothetical protein [Leptolinea tardivitalis]|uniref:Uncharacterized protein n=1 Tax=Leptolinea tardivitalis TaxID=229920 RepID=A0A0P6X095_9CHLR|nr:hypothetical protein [Leptolinea tardivitalis]KPL72625.1 hypothetical protein ADM99_05855 [Leptolinea tardivitalis]GAP21054.1 hypothetical protein LTAR_01259 [Leptolinea tardivitalis]
MKSRQILSDEAEWTIDARLSDATCDTILQALKAVENWLFQGRIQPRTSSQLFKTIGIYWKPSPPFWWKTRYHHVEFSTTFVVGEALCCDTAVHEIAHVLDNFLGMHPLSTIFGGGPADLMCRSIGAEPECFFPRFRAPGFEKRMTALCVEQNPTLYGRSLGPAEDFAESFRLVVTNPDYLHSSAPCRYDWFENWRLTLLDQFEK